MASATWRWRGDMQVLIDAASATGNFVLDVLSPVSEEIVVVVVGGMVLWVWYQNLRAWVRVQAEKRRVQRRAQCSETEDIGSVGSKED